MLLATFHATWPGLPALREQNETDARTGVGWGVQRAELREKQPGQSSQGPLPARFHPRPSITELPQHPSLSINPVFGWLEPKESFINTSSFLAFLILFLVIIVQWLYWKIQSRFFKYLILLSLVNRLIFLLISSREVLFKIFEVMSSWRRTGPSSCGWFLFDSFYFPQSAIWRVLTLSPRDSAGQCRTPPDLSLWAVEFTSSPSEAGFHLVLPESADEEP